VKVFNNHTSTVKTFHHNEQTMAMNYQHFCSKFKVNLDHNYNTLTGYGECGTLEFDTYVYVLIADMIL
jgi:hypothetical protein